MVFILFSTTKCVLFNKINPCPFLGFVKDMIPSVQERKKNVHVFMNFYPYLCRLQNTIPNPNIKVDNSNKSLDFVGDRLKFDDWKPVLEAISNDRTLHFISVRSRHLNAKGKFSSV